MPSNNAPSGPFLQVWVVSAGRTIVGDGTLSHAVGARLNTPPLTGTPSFIIRPTQERSSKIATRCFFDVCRRLEILPSA